MYSKVAIKIYSAIKHGKIKTRKEFWESYFDINNWKNLDIATENDAVYLNENKFNLICIFDNEFPKINENAKQSDKPFLFVYVGDIALLGKINHNIAVIGVLNPSENIARREKEIVQILITNNQNIVSGLAIGCDSIAHKVCIQYGKKTIAFLPSTLENFFPKVNKNLANEIILNGGLIVTEYVLESKNKYDSVNRFIERDRLQVMFAKAVVLIASFRKGEGDSGSRHAMSKAKQYGLQRYAMYNEKTDNDDKMFGLNKDLIESGVTILTQSNIKDLIN